MRDGRLSGRQPTTGAPYEAPYVVSSLQVDDRSLDARRGG